MWFLPSLGLSSAQLNLRKITQIFPYGSILTFIPREHAAGLQVATHSQIHHHSNHNPAFTSSCTPPGKHYRHAVTVQVPRAKLSINSRKVVNIQTRESTPIYHKQLHGIRTSFTSSSQSQEAVLLSSCQHSSPLHVNSRRASVYTVTGERFISKLFLARVLVAGGWSTLVEFATTEATTQPH